MSVSLDKFLEEERRKHSLSNDGKMQPLDNDGQLTSAGAKLISASANNKGQVKSLKSALKDPAFVNKIQNLEDKRQDLYLQILRKRGQLLTEQNGAQIIVSYPKVCLVNGWYVWSLLTKFVV